MTASMMVAGTEAETLYLQIQAAMKENPLEGRVRFLQETGWSQKTPF